ncbi:hypothetical protein QBC34DRAFT_309493 [Podospora aff. communis PSN243]|uniref:F-box domain-containing protein n=1 Tax=Podospora aff. communis PSN243 TaxID=3040156 RepID=A0AAV9G9H0_9PEZI|nr:hypothetical protein QBC34DRAFT_309493 [Podospora aff. communis PSN243]
MAHPAPHASAAIGESTETPTSSVPEAVSSSPVPGQVDATREDQTSSPSEREPLHIKLLPPDILLEIGDQLRQNPESILAFALTCKDFYQSDLLQRMGMAAGSPLRGQQLHAFLLLLEKDPSIGNQWYYCMECCVLHPFTPESDTRSPWSGIVDQMTPKFCLRSFRYKLTYNHARLVMNRHLYGAPCGLSLDSLNVPPTRVPSESTTESPEWEESWCAKVIDNELFLRATRTISSHDGNHRSLRRFLNSPGYWWCNFTILAMDRLFREPLFADRPPFPLFFECRDVRCSCRWCPTEWYTTIEWKESPGGSQSRGPSSSSEKQKGQFAWFITVVSYHRLGTCRSFRDWNWAVMTDAMAPFHLDDMRAAEHEERIRALGSVRDIWRAAVAAESQ